MSERYISINDKLVTESDAKISVSDLALQRGYGIFDFLKTIDNRPIFIDDYLDRFYNSANEMNLEVMLGRAELKKTLMKLMQHNNLPDSGIKLILTGGYSEDGYAMGKPNLIITQTPLIINDDNYEAGIKLVTFEHQRQLPYVKTIDYLRAIQLQPYIKQHHANDVLYHNNGSILEIPRANFFIITDNEVITQKRNVLKGVTRGKVLGLKITDYAVVEKDYSLDDLLYAKEAFITSTTKNAFPVTEIDGRQIGDGKAGAVTKQIRDELIKLIENYTLPVAYETH